MDIEKTKQYYSEFTREDCCLCDYCQNYIDEIKAAYPKVAEYLMTLGVDIEIPFELMLPVQYVNEYLKYDIAMYLVAGNTDGFEQTIIGDVDIDIETSHPTATYKGEHFIISAGPFLIKANTDKYNLEV